MYECKLTYKGYIKELFYRKGESEKEFLKFLKMFHWPKGTWKITKIG